MPGLIKTRLSIRFTRDPHVSARIVTSVLGPEFPEVMRAAVRGDETAFARLWRDNQPPLLRYLRVVTGDNPDDVASEVWLEVARGLERFHGGEGEFRGWLFTLARRRVIDLHRYNARRPVVFTGDPE